MIMGGSVIIYFISYHLGQQNKQDSTHTHTHTVCPTHGKEKVEQPPVFITSLADGLENTLHLQHGDGA